MQNHEDADKLEGQLTPTTSFLHVQQGGEVEAVPDPPTAAQGQGARGLWLSEKRQAGGPGESALSFGINAQSIIGGSPESE